MPDPLKVTVQVPEGNTVTAAGVQKNGHVIGMIVYLPFAAPGENVNANGNDVRFTTGRGPLEFVKVDPETGPVRFLGSVYHRGASGTGKQRGYSVVEE